MPSQIPPQKSNKTSVRMRLPTDFAHRTSIMTHITYLISNRRAIAFALGHVRLTLVTNTRGAKTDSTAKEQQNKIENALVDWFRASHKHHDTHDLPNKQPTSNCVRIRSCSTNTSHQHAWCQDRFHCKRATKWLWECAGWLISRITQASWHTWLS